MSCSNNVIHYERRLSVTAGVWSQWLAQISSFLRNKPLGAVGAVLFVFTIAVAVIGPLAAPSGPNVTDANQRFAPPSTESRTAAEVHRTFPEGPEMVLDGGATAGGVASTILDLGGERPRILREGLVPASSLERLLPDVVQGQARL